VSANPVADSLFAFYSFNEVVDGMVVDGMGARHGQMRGGVSIVNDPERGNVLALDGAAGSFVLLPDDLLYTLTDLTISVWFRDTDPDDRHWTRVFDFGAGNTNYFMLTPRSGHGDLRFEGRVQYPDNAPRVVYTDMVHDEWVHVAITTGGGTMRMYVNGELADENDDFPFNASEMGATDGNFLGNSQWPDPFFMGFIDDLAIYSAVLTPEQIREVMEHSFVTPASALATVVPPAARATVDTTPNADGMFLRYTFNEIVDGIVFDDINNNHGQIVNGGQIVNDPARGPVLFLDGTNQHVRMPDNITAGLNAMTISAWYRWTDDYDRHWSRVIDIGSGTHSYIFFSPRSGYDTLMFENNSADTPMTRVMGPFSLHNEWVHIAGTIANGRKYFFVNGELVGENDTEFAPHLLGDTDQNWIGRSQFGADAFFEGFIDDVIFFDRALSQAEIQALMNEDFRDIRGGAPAAADPAVAEAHAADAPVQVAAPDAPAAPVQVAEEAAAPAPDTADPIALLAVGAIAAIASAGGIIIAKKRRN
jgi:hypothetical protein